MFDYKIFDNNITTLSSQMEDNIVKNISIPQDWIQVWTSLGPKSPMQNQFYTYIFVNEREWKNFEK